MALNDWNKFLIGIKTKMAKNCQIEITFSIPTNDFFCCYVGKPWLNFIPIGSSVYGSQCIK